MRGLRVKKLLVESIYWLLLVVAVVWALFPILYVGISSFKLPTNIWTYPPTFVGPFTLDNYRDLILKWPSYLGHLRNSLIITVGTLLITLFFSTMAAFAFARFKNKLLKPVALSLVATRMLPAIVITIPLFPLFNSLGLLDRHVTLMIVYSAFFLSLAILVIKTFIDDVPIELEDSAMIDGCSRLQAFVTITLPLAAPGIVAIVVIDAIDVWNEYLFAFLFTSSAARTAPTSIAEIMGGVFGVEWGSLLAACVIQFVPILIFLLIMQKYLVKGMRVGAIK